MHRLSYKHLPASLEINRDWESDTGFNGKKVITQCKDKHQQWNSDKWSCSGSLAGWFCGLHFAETVSISCLASWMFSGRGQILSSIQSLQFPSTTLQLSSVFLHQILSRVFSCAKHLEVVLPGMFQARVSLPHHWRQVPLPKCRKGCFALNPRKKLSVLDYF